MEKVWLVIASLFLAFRTSSEEVIEYQKELDKREVFGTYYEQAEEKMKAMSLEEKAGQLFLARMNEDTIFSELESIHPGGYVLFARDFEDETKESISGRLKSYQEKSNIPLVMAVDEEGGIVTRVSKYSAFRKSKFLSNRELYNQGGFPLIEETEREKVALLKEIGLNLNLAPVADISLSPNDYMYKRSLGQDASVTSEYIRKLVRIDKENEFADCLKHFPGYGNNVDTHTGIAYDERSYDSFTQNNYLPFQAGIEEKVPTILISHNIVVSMDGENPASLSKKVHQELREKLGFSGIIITDDLAMDAISKYTRSENSAVLAVLAGNDFIITSNLRDDYEAVLKAFSEGKITEDILNTAVRRILAFKYQYHIA